MRHIMVMNAKGGCGKSTIATNLAAYYASEGYDTSLADFDPQRSSLDWLESRSDELPTIHGVEGYRDGLKAMPRNSDFVIIDAPARSHGTELTQLVSRAESIIVPVLPATIDIKASSRFIKNELMAVGRVARREARVAVVANRVREYTLIFDQLDEHLERLRVPYLTALRDAQNYVRAYSRGLGVHELPEYLAWPDWEQWDPLLEWLESRRSRPVAARG